MTLQRVTLPEPGSPTSRAASLERLHGLIRSINNDLDLDRTLQSVCQGLVDGLGFEIAMLNLVMPGGELEVVAGVGSPEACATLLGTSSPRHVWDDYLRVCQPVGDLLVDYLHLLPREGAMPTWTPDTPISDDDGAWHPLDELFAPLRTARSGLLGVISVALPGDGRRPAPDQLVLLEMYAAQASVAIENAQLHTTLLGQSEDRAEALGRLSTIVGNTPVAIVELGLDGVVRLWNPAAERIFGWSKDDVIGGMNPVVDVEDDADLQRLHDKPLVREPVRRRRRDGSAVDLEMSASVLRDGDGRPFGYLGVYADMTERIALEGDLRTAAYTDALTGLANRAAFGECLELAAAAGGATVLLLDLDGFKSVNDTAGHAAGDRVLVEVGRRIEATCRDGDLVARLGGDEFVVLLNGGTTRNPTSDDAVEALAERLVGVLAQSVDVAGRAVRLGASVGVARLRGPGTADDLLRDADVAMYAAKAQGKGRYKVFEPRLRADLLERTDRIADLRSALEREEMFVRWHPIVRVADQQLLGFESLVRWQHPVHGELPPAAFVALAEESGLVVELGRQVLHRSCATLRRWQDEVPAAANTQISVNLSPLQLQHSDIVATVRETLADTGVGPDKLLLELTEDVLLEDVKAAVEVLDDLRGLGVRLAIDDFGAGYSSLAYLKRLPIDVVKLDRSLLSEVETDSAALALFDAVVALVARLGYTAVAEGVETVGQWELLRQLTCPVAQGFLLAAPLLEADARRMLAIGRPSSGVRPAS